MLARGEQGRRAERSGVCGGRELWGSGICAPMWPFLHPSMSLNCCSIKAELRIQTAHNRKALGRQAQDKRNESRDNNEKWTTAL